MLVWGSGFRSMGIDGTGPFLYNGERESIKKSSENSLLRRTIESEEKSGKAEDDGLWVEEGNWV